MQTPSRHNQTALAFLAAAAKTGDQQAFALIYQACSGEIARFCSRHVGADAGADLAQETWIGAARSLHRLGNPEKLRAFLYKIAINKIRDHWRRQQRHQRLSDSLNQLPEPTNPEDPRSDEATSLVQILATLDPERQLLLRLFYGADFSVHEIADVLGVPQGTVKSRLFHARAVLKRAYEGDEE